MKLISLVLAVCLLTVCSSYALNKVIYGEDNRVDVYESNNAFFVDLSRSTAAMISSTNIKSNADGSFTVTGDTLQSIGLCSSERFSQQISSAVCSGFLVAKDIIVTAGHCYAESTSCQNYKWVFDFKSSDSGVDPEIQVSANSVYSCKKVVAQVLNNYNKTDYSVIKLDREVEGYEPLEVRKTGKIENNTPIVVIGSPTGIPTKIADGATVRSNSNAVYFTTNLDTYGGNSGSAVFNVATGVVEGILVRGDNDYVRSPAGCMVSNICSQNGCRGEDVTRITKVKEIMDIAQ